MKILVLLFLIMFSEFTYCAGELEVYLISGYRTDGKFNIVDISQDDYPSADLGIKINIDNVRLIKVEDITENTGLCGSDETIRFYMLSDKPINKITMRVIVKSPCVKKAYDIGSLKITIATVDKKVYSKILRFKSRWAEYLLKSY